MSSFPVKIYIVALVLRLIPVLLTANLGIGLDDMFQYDMLARSLAAGHGFRWYAQQDLKLLEPYVDFDLSTATGYDPEFGVYTSFRAPLYPAFLALIYSFSGLDFSRFFAARLAQAIFLGAPLAPLTYFVSKILCVMRNPKADVRERPLRDGGNGEKTSRLSAWIVACYPMLLVYPLGLGTENLFFILLLSSFLFLLKSLARPSAFRLLLSGLLLALTALTRSVILPFAFLAFGALFFRHRKRAFLFIFAFLLAISPWIVRNSLLHGKPTGIETSLGYNLYLGYHPAGNGSFVFGPSLDLLAIMDDSERDLVGTRKALEFIRAEPERLIPLALNRLGFFFGLEKRVLMYFYSNNLLGYMPLPLLLFLSAVLLLPFVFLSVISVIGFFALESSPQKALLGLLFLAYILPHVLILSEDRFHLALIPFFAILASHVLISIREKKMDWKIARPSTLFAVALVVSLFLNWGLELNRDADKIAQLLSPTGNQSHFPY
ncbi:MAG: hypothetical protein DCC59_12805 [Chloroflexi bacterium]|nr:hypothetical protein [Anaerolineales bacterium]MCQ3953995.1 hypothetical protein [Chloroflexota bacterium]RIK50698.1 MAG: hypothetical protein DCC59_12805 [Chloroflexota bacterium]